MDETKTTEKQKKSRLSRIIRIVYKTILGLILLVALVALSILTPPVQNFIKGKATAWLSEKLKTKVAIGKIYIGFPKKVVIENIYLEDRGKDTLLSGGKLQVDIAMLRLLRSELEVSRIEIADLTAKVKRQLPDTLYNFQFIIDAFASGDTVQQKDSSPGMKISVKNIDLDNIRLLYKDDITGNDVTLGLRHFDTEFDVFDIDKMKFDIPETNLEGVNAYVHQRQPIHAPSENKDNEPTDSATTYPDINFRKLNISDIYLDYGNEVSQLFSKINLGSFSIDADKIDLQKQTIVLNTFALKNTTASVLINKSQTAAIVKEKADTVASLIKNKPKKSPPGNETINAGSPAEPLVNTAATKGWAVLVKNISLDNNNFAFDNNNNAPAGKGIDYMHLGVKELILHADNFLYTPDSMRASITKGSMSEKSGFRLTALRTDFLYAANGAYLHNLLLETPGTTLRRSATVGYTSLEGVQKDIGTLKLNIDLTQSKVQVKDILTFAPFLDNQPALSNPQATWLLDGNITGAVNNLNIHRLDVRALNNTSLNMHGTITGLPDPKKLKGDIVINSFKTSGKDIRLLAPKGSLPTSIRLPETYNLRGSITGSIYSAKANLSLNTDLGSAALNGTAANITDKQRATYNATLTAKQLDLGAILKNDTTYGPVTATVTASGTGYDKQIVNAKLNAIINSVVYNRYNYNNIKLDAQLAKKLADFNLNVQDPNITLAIRGKADLTTEYPAISVNAAIDSIKTLALHLTSDTLEYRGNITADFPVTDIKNPEGRLLVTQSALAMGQRRYTLDTLSLIAGKSDTGRFIRLNADAVNVALTGKYNLAQLATAVMQTIQPYYAIMPGPSKPDTLSDYDFYFTGQIVNTPLLKAFVPTLTRLDPITMNAHFVRNNGFQAHLDAPMIIMGDNRIKQFQLNAGTGNNAIRIRTELEQFRSGSSLIVHDTRLYARIADNKINFGLNLKDADNKNKYRLGGIFAQPDTGVYTLSLNRDSILLNYDKWAIGPDNLVKLDKGDIHISDFILSSKGQVLSLNSMAQERNAPLEVKFTGFRIGTLTAFAKQDSLLADGTINGNIIVKNIATQPVFTSNLNISDLMIKKDTVGDIALKVDNSTANIFNADVALTGKGNEVLINGNYVVKPDNQSTIDLKTDVRKLQMSSVEALSFGSISKASGYIDGKLNIAGTFDKPSVNGNLNFNKAAFSPTMLGSYFMVDQQKIYVNDKGINFDHFTIKDSSGNTLSLDGNAYTSNFVNYKFDMSLAATNFEALNSTKVNSKLFYGKFFFDTNLDITGTEAAPVVDGDLTVNANTRLTIVLPEDEPGVVEREGIVRFIDVDSIKTNTTLLLAKDTVRSSAPTGMDISVNIEVQKEAELTLVVDEMNGDYLKMQGTAQLTGGIDPSGKTTLSGTYEIDKGQYNLSFNFLKRKFDIKKGSTITWLGDPMKANIDLTAVYTASTSPQTLVDAAGATTDATYKQKLPFEVDLILKGELLKPVITFDVELPENKNYNVSGALTDQVQLALANLRSQPDQMNKQVFALLLLNRFVAQDPFASSGGGFNAGTMARQSVSKILSDQLNNLAAGLIKGVDLNFDLQSNEDYTTKEMQNRTDLNVSLSKRLLSDRLKVTVGSNFALEGPETTTAQSSNNLAGNVALDYMLSKDGRYLVRAYRKNEYEGELDGYIIETGINFIIRFDYDQFRELFHSPKQKIRQQRKHDKKEAGATVEGGKAAAVNSGALK